MTKDTSMDTELPLNGCHEHMTFLEDCADCWKRFFESGAVHQNCIPRGTSSVDTELRYLVYRMKYPPSKGAYQVKVDDVMKAIQEFVAQKQQEARIDELNKLAQATNIISEKPLIYGVTSTEIAYRLAALTKAGE